MGKSWPSAWKMKRQSALPVEVNRTKLGVRISKVCVEKVGWIRRTPPEVASAESSDLLQPQ
jgi:hypothetical protein